MATTGLEGASPRLLAQIDRDLAQGEHVVHHLVNIIRTEFSDLPKPALYAQVYTRFAQQSAAPDDPRSAIPIEERFDVEELCMMLSVALMHLARPESANG